VAPGATVELEDETVSYTNLVQLQGAKPVRHLKHGTGDTEEGADDREIRGLADALEARRRVRVGSAPREAGVGVERARGGIRYRS
jgi:hypothetical protein